MGTTTTTTYDQRDRRPIAADVATVARRGHAPMRPLDTVTAEDLADMRAVARAAVGRDRADDAVSSALLACADATEGARSTVLPMLATSDRGRALRTFGNVCRDMVRTEARHHAAVVASLDADGPAAVVDRDVSRSVIFRADVIGTAVRSALATADRPNGTDAAVSAAADAVAAVRWSRKVSEQTLPNAVHIVTEQSLATMLDRARQMGYGDHQTAAEDRSDDRYAAARQVTYVMSAAVPMMSTGTVAAAIRDAVAADGRTLGRLLYDHCDVTRERSRSAVIVATGRTAERSVIRWTDLLSAIDVSTSKPYVRMLQRMAAAIGTAAMSAAVRFECADATAGRSRTTAAARGRLAAVAAGPAPVRSVPVPVVPVGPFVRSENATTAAEAAGRSRSAVVTYNRRRSAAMRAFYGRSAAIVRNLP